MNKLILTSFKLSANLKHVLIYKSTFKIMKINYYHSLIFFNLCIFLSAIEYLKSNSLLILSLFLILCIGISHGSLDHIKGKKLIKEYYYDNILSSTILDIFLIFFYLLLAQAVIYVLNVNRMITRLFLVAFVTLCISGAFYLLFKSKPLDKKSFFSRWFYAAGFYAVIYDMVLITTSYAILMFTLIKTKKRVSEWLK